MPQHHELAQQSRSMVRGLREFMNSGKSSTPRPAPVRKSRDLFPENGKNRDIGVVDVPRPDSIWRRPGVVQGSGRGRALEPEYPSSR
jgi:hypothetical protein